MSSKKSISKRQAEQVPAVVRKYTPDVPAKILDTLVGSKTIAHVCVELGISKTTYYEWIKIYPEMKDAHDRARAAQEAFYVDTGVAGMFGHIQVNPKLYDILTKNVIGWSKNDMSIPSQQINVQNMQINQMPTSELESKIVEQLKRTGMLPQDDGSAK